MSAEWITLIWLLSGLVLIASEVLVPGLFVMFLGMAAIMIAGLRWISGMEHLGISFLLWGVLSALLVVGFRSMAMRLIGKGEQRKAYVNDQDEVDALGAEVEVVKACSEDDSEGRIRYQGTTWSAMSLGGPLAAGSRARLVARENLVWMVEPADALDAFSETSANQRALQSFDKALQSQPETDATPDTEAEAEEAEVEVSRKRPTEQRLKRS